MPMHRPDEPGAMADPALTVYFDGACALCSAEIRHYAGQAGAEQVAFCDVAAPDARPGPGLDRDAALARFHVRQADGRIVSGAAAFVALWAQLPRWRWAARIAQAPGVLTVLEALYRLFLPVRPLLSRIAASLGAKPLRQR